MQVSYDDYRHARENLINVVNSGLTDSDKDFLISFETGTPDWSKCSASDLSRYPSIKWKLQNIAKLKAKNPAKHNEGLGKLAKYLNRE